MPRKSKNSQKSTNDPAVAIWVGDSSGSMTTMGQSPSLGAEEFIKTHIKLAEEGTPLWLHFSTFNSNARCIYSGLANEMTQQNIDNCVDAMRPCGGTRFFDTVVEICTLIPQLVQNLMDTLPKEVQGLSPNITVSTTIMTDGADNYSSRNSQANMCTTVQKLRNDGRVFIFLGANQDAITVGMKYGFDPNMCLQVGSDPLFSRAAFASATNASARALSSQIPDFVGNERSTSCSVGEAMQYSQPNDLTSFPNAPAQPHIVRHVVPVPNLSLGGGERS